VVWLKGSRTAIVLPIPSDHPISVVGEAILSQDLTIQSLQRDAPQRAIQAVDR
jgi:hypothetical protein